MNSRWSASRFGTYLGCKQKYRLTYIDDLVVIGRDSPLATKGLAFHEIAEQMNSSRTIEDLNKIAESVLQEKNFDKEKYPVSKAIPRFYYWWKEYVSKYENQGFKVYRENWENGKIKDQPLTGAIDMLLINDNTKEVKIYDYKTGSQAKIAGYENQLLLYAYMVAKRLNIPENEISDKISTYLFFPLAGLKDEELTDEKIAEKMMLKTMKQLVFTNEDVSNVISSFEKIVEDSDSMDWNTTNAESIATMSYACSFCSFCGHIKLCPASHKSGLMFPRKAKVFTKQQLKEMEVKSL